MIPAPLNEWRSGISPTAERGALRPPLFLLCHRTLSGRRSGISPTVTPPIRNCRAGREPGECWAPNKHPRSLAAGGRIESPCPISASMPSCYVVYLILDGPASRFAGSRDEWTRLRPACSRGIPGKRSHRLLQGLQMTGPVRLPRTLPRAHKTGVPCEEKILPDAIICILDISFRLEVFEGE